jgi:gas vesicle protein
MEAYLTLNPRPRSNDIMKSKTSEASALLAFLAGAMVAAGLTLLLTPKAGREVREKLGDVSEGAVQKFRECAREAKFRVSPKTKEDAFYYEGGDCWI